MRVDRYNRKKQNAKFSYGVYLWSAWAHSQKRWSGAHERAIKSTHTEWERETHIHPMIMFDTRNNLQ